MATTSRGIVYPTTGNAVTPLATRFADLATSTDIAIDAVDTKFSNDNHQFYGPAASLGGVIGMKLGDTYQESDGNKVLWKYDGTNWVTNEGGMYLIRPTSVTNGTIAEDGSAVPTASATQMIANGVFSSRFRAYKVIGAVQCAAATGQPAIQFATGGVVNTSSIYNSQLLSSSGSTASGGIEGSINRLNLPATTGTFHTFEMFLSGPGLDTLETAGNWSNISYGGGTVGYRNAGFYFGSRTTILDGIALGHVASTFSGSGAMSYLKVYGLA